MTPSNEMDPPSLSDLTKAEIDTAPGSDSLSRRLFLRRATMAGAAVAAVGCAPGEETTGDSGQVSDLDRDPQRTSSARADSALDIEHSPRSHTAAVDAAEAAPYSRYDPVLPPLPTERTTRVHWRAQEIPLRITPDIVVAAWTFEGDIPGPILHVQQGDTVEFTLTNEGVVPHSMDFHSSQLNPQVAFRSVPQGESVSFTFTPEYAGAFMYHCGTGPVLMHIGTGMYGAMIVSPREALPEAKEFVLVQSEYYINEPDADGLTTFDYRKMMSTLPDYVVFNGRPDQYLREPMRVNVGDRVRFWVVAAGPTHPCAFHVVGEQFDTVYIGSPPGSAIQGVQTFNVPAGGGMVFEFIADIAGEFPVVNHGFGHGQKGSMGYLVVE